MSGGFFRGTSADQDTRFSNKQAKLMKSQKFAPELDHLVDMTKVKLDVMRPWIANRVTEILGFEDEVLINFIYGLLEGKEVNGKEVQISLTGFMEKNTGKFMKELWSLLLSAGKNASGVPQQLLDAKGEEIRKKQEEQDRIAGEVQKKREKESREIELERSRIMDGEVEPKANHNAERSEVEREVGNRNGVKGGSRGSHSRSMSRSRSNSRSPPHGSMSRSPEGRRRSPPRRRSMTPPRRRQIARVSASPRRKSSYYRRRSRSRSITRSPSPLRRRMRSPIRRRSPSPNIHRRSPSPVRRRRSPSPLRRRRSPSPLRRRRSPSPFRRRRTPSPTRRRSPIRRRRSPSPYRRRRSPTPVRRRSPLPMRNRSPSPVLRRPAPSRQRSPTPVRSSPSRSRSASPVGHRSPSPRHKKSPIPIRRRSPSPVRRRSPTLSPRRSPVYSSSQSPPRRRSSLDRKMSSKGLRSPVQPTGDGIRSPQGYPPHRENLRSKESDMSHSPRKSPIIEESPVLARKESPNESPARYKRENDMDVKRQNARGVIPDMRKDKEENKHDWEDEDHKSRSSHRRSQPSSVKDQEKDYSPDKAGRRAPESRSRLDKMEPRRKDQEFKNEKVPSKGVRLETHNQRSPTIRGEKQLTPHKRENEKSDERDHSPPSSVEEKEGFLKSSTMLVSKVENNNQSATDSEGNGKHRHEGREKRKHKRSERREADSDDDSSYDSEKEGRKEAKKRRKEEKKLRKEEKRRRREERHRKREERHSEKLKTKGHYDGDEESESEQKKLEIELRQKALESLKAKKGISN